MGACWAEQDENKVKGALRMEITRLELSDQLTALSKSWIDGSLASFRANKDWADKAIAQLPDEKLHRALDANTNSIAVIMKHVAGNLLSRWTDFLTTDGEKPWRNRDDEFDDSFSNRHELLAYWESGWSRLFGTVQSLQAADLLKTVTIRGEPLSVPLAIQRSLAHCGYHVGQIMLIARVLAGENWQTITIPRGGSQAFNEQHWGRAHFQATTKQQLLPVTDTEHTDRNQL